MSIAVANTREGKEAAALLAGCVVVEPARNQLQIDIDTKEDWDWFEASIARVSTKWPCTWERTPSPSGEPWHYHVVVTFRDLPEPLLNQWQRIALQAVLGSDRSRELNSVIDIMLGDPLPTIFFERKSSGGF